MLAVVGGLVRNLVVVIFLNALLEMLLPQGGFRRYIRLVTGLIVILMIVGTIAALLGKLPRLEPVIAGRPAAVDFGDAAENQSEKIGLTHRLQVLQQCRDSLENLLRDEIAATGEWELVEAVIILDEERDSSTFGAPRQIDLLVKATAAAGERVNPISIDPVKVEGSEKSAEKAARPAERLPGLEQSLAGLLELSPALVTVTINE